MELVCDGDDNCSCCDGNGSLRFEKTDWGNSKSKEDSRPSRPQHCLNRQEYSEEFWRPKEIWCHLDSGESSPANL